MWKLAWRNLWRNRTRTAILISAIGLSYAMFLIFLGVGDYMYGKMENTAAQMAGGDVILHAEGFWAQQTTELYIAEPGPVVERIEAREGVEHVIPRVMVQGLASTSTGNAPVQLTGIDPEREVQLRDIVSWIDEGSLRGEELDARGHPLVLGGENVEELDLELGDRVVVTSTDVDGELTRELFFLSGIIRTGSGAMQSAMAFTTLEAARSMVGYDGGVSQLGVVLAPGLAPRDTARQIEGDLGARAEGLEVLSWKEAMPEMVGFVEIDRAFTYVIMIVLFFIVAFAIANSFMMSVMERIREFGLFNALGMRAMRVGRLVIAETLCLIVVSMSIGLAVALVGHTLIATYGIDLTTFMGDSDLEIAGVGYGDAMMYSRIPPEQWALASGIVMLFVLLTSLYPAYRAGRLSPAEAMRFFE